MPHLTLIPPGDYVLARDVCSYGYFLLAPNYWNVRKQVFTTVLRVGRSTVGVVISQLTPPAASARPPRTSLNHTLAAVVPGSPLRVQLSRTLTRTERAALRLQLTRMLRLDESAHAIADFHRVDPRGAATGRGRLFRSSTLFEDVIKTVTSCNVTWAGTIIMNRRLCEVAGARLLIGKVSRFAFPTAAKLAAISPALLRAKCSVGYRDQRIVDLAKLFCTSRRRGGIDIHLLENPVTPDQQVFDYLMKLPGIGPYAAANIMQLLGRYSKLPLDTESVRHGRVVMGLKGTPAAIMKRLHKHFAIKGKHAFRSYWFELWEDYEARNGPSHTWERDAAGRMFTAAILNKKA